MIIIQFSISLPTVNVHASPLLDKTPDRIRRMFGAIAPWYDFLNHFLSFGIDRHWRRRTARQLLNEKTISGDILDVCCGTGDLTLVFLKQQQNQIERHHFGIDFSPEMIERAEQKAKKFPTVQFAVGDALNLPFEKNRFAVVAVAFGLRNVVDTQQGLIEMVRVCKQGGTVAVLEFSMPTLPILKQCYRFYFRSVLPRLGQWFAKNHDQAYDYLPASVLSFERPDELVKRLEQLNVTDIQTKPMTFGIATLIWGRKKEEEMSNGMFSHNEGLP